jgi:hypothetical protein
MDAAKDVVAQATPKWRLTRISLHRLRENSFECKVGIDARDVSREDTANLVRFRDTFLSLLAFTAMVPVRPLIKGTFTFAMGNSKYAQISLGPMNYTFPETPILSFAPLVGGFAFDESYRAAVWFIWHAINASEPVHRFLNLAVAYELAVGHDSPVRGSRAPQCSLCGTEISSCPFCNKENKVPVTLRERARFLFAEPGLLNDFIAFRNRFFHGKVTDLSNDDTQALHRLNTDLLVNIRNYFGQGLGLRNIAAADIGQAINVPDILMTVFYEQKN